MEIMVKRKVVAVVLSVLSLSATLYWELLGGPALIALSDPLHMLTMPVGLALAAIKEVAYPGASLHSRLRRARVTLYLWQAIVGLADFLPATRLSFEFNQLNPDLPLFPGTLEAVHCFYLAMTFDLIVLRPVEVWGGATRPRPTGRIIRRLRVNG